MYTLLFLYKGAVFLKTAVYTGYAQNGMHIKQTSSTMTEEEHDTV
jgi:hypothetical protein